MTEVATRVQFARESVAEVIDEIQPLLRAHWEEIAQYPDIPLQVNFEAYRQGEKLGQLRIFTVRVDSKLVGYAIYQVAQPLHYSTSLQARQDVIFLEESYRHGRIGWKLIEFADERLRLDGVQVVYQHIKPAHNFGPLLERIGYELSELLYSRRLN